MSFADLLLPSLFRYRMPELRLSAGGWLPFAKMPPPARRLLRIEAAPGKELPALGDKLAAGEQLGLVGAMPVCSPLPAVVAEIRPSPYLHGGNAGFAVVIEQDPEGPKFETLGPLGDDATRPELLERLDALGICAFGHDSLPLSSLLAVAPRKLVVIAADGEPLLGSESQLLLDSLHELDEVVALLKRIAGSDLACLAVPKAHAEAAHKAVPEATVVALPDRYPETLPEMAARRCGGGRPVAALTLESALAAHRAITKGEPTFERFITVIGADRSRKNVSVPIGAAASEVLAFAGVTVQPEDLLLCGGPMRGRSEDLPDACVEASTTALMVISKVEAGAIENDPCISCGSCVEVCPTRLQPQWLGRNAEFGFFDRNEELAIDSCIGCGLCAYVCPSGRPLLHWIELTLTELEKARAAAREA